MKALYYAWFLALLAFATTAFAQAPTVTSPTNGATNVNPNSYTIAVSSSSTDNEPPNDPETINIEISNQSDFAGSFYWSSNDYTRDTDAPDVYSEAGPTLVSSTTYYIRGTSDKNGPGTTSSFTTAGAPVTGTNRLSNVNGVASNTTAQSTSVFPNARRITLDLNQTIPNATEYVIQFDTTSSAFANVVDSVIITGTSTRIQVDIGGIRGAKLSGSTVFVRTHGRNASSFGPFGNIRKFGWPMQPCKLESPTGTINRYAFKLWTTAVGRASRYYFQVSTSPTFSTPYTMTGALASKNETVSGITGNVFRNNYSVGDAGRAFDYLGQLSNNTYYVRVRAWNSQQNGYWADTLTVSPLPILTSGFTNLTNGQTNVPVSYTFQFRDDPNYTETSWQMQIATDAGFSSIISDQSGITNRRGYYPNLNYNTTYYARVRSFVSASASAWVTASFTTQALPAISVTSPAASQVWPNTYVWAYCTWEGSVTQYDWEINKTNSPTSSFSGSSTYYGRNFPSYLVKGGNYQIRVRGTNSGQGITGSWSPWVSFSVAAASPIPAAQGPQKADIVAARLGSEGPVAPIAYPNPFTDRILLELPAQTVAFRVTDISGRLVHTGTLPVGVQEVGAGWPKGVYMVTVETSEQGIKRLRVVKQ